MDDLDNKFKKKYIATSSEGYLYLMLLPTEKCNFRCVYCYEDFEIGKMSQDTVHGIKNLLTKAAPTLKNLTIAWFGGEPTLNSKAIEDISSHIMDLKRTYGFKYNGGMTTNGYLLNYPLFNRLVELGVNTYQVSLDGGKEAHNKTRIQLNGSGSFDQIWHNLISFKQSQHDFKLVIRLHVTDDNAQSMLDLCHQITQNFGSDKRYTIHVESIKNLGKGVTGDGSKHQPSDGERTVNKIKELMSYNLDTVSKHTKKNPYICYAAMPKQLLIRADGRIGKCSVMFNDDRNTLGKINRDGSYSLDGDKLELWVRGFISLDKREIGCPASNLPKLKHTSVRQGNEIQVVNVA
ncbi:radical SAM protein [Shewanella sp. VB17]|uniref:radical SAM protein n=1 Tax=Shewanella sp. VB17 TaxID=2739432 RepID=UPI0015671F3A|nr:radical SAM protein [Shewanella sp. VB17]NRD74915.1 radical SAM protein [Shewanella sp. VB17]